MISNAGNPLSLPIHPRAGRIQRRRALGTLLGAFLAACTDGHEGSVAPGAQPLPAGADFLLGDAALDGLSAFEAEVESLRLERQDGTLTGESLAASLRIEFTGLSARSRLIAHADFPSGDYAGARVRFRPLGYVARNLDGAPVEVVAAADEFLAPFAAPQEIAPMERVSVAIDLDLVRSLAGDPATGPLAFTPRGSAAVERAAALALDEFDALVTARDTGTLALTLVPFADGERRVPIDPFSAGIGPDSRLVDRQGFLFDQAAFFYTLLVPGLSVVHVAASLRAGGDPLLLVERLELEDQDGGASPISAVFPVALDGRVVGLRPGISFDLAVREIERGSVLAAPFFASRAGGPDPLTIQVAFDGRALVFAAGDVVPAGALAVGQEVKVRFPSFSGEPFLAARVAILEPVPSVAGRVVSTDLSGGIELALSPGDPLLRAGLVASSATPVAVALGEAPIALETAGEPALLPGDLVSGPGLLVRGRLSGPPERPLLAAEQVRVRAGRLAGATVTQASEVGGFLTTSGGSLEESFGAPLVPQTLILVPDAIFLGAARSRAEFFALWDALEGGDVLEVDVEGLAAGTGGDARAFTIVSRVR